MPHLLFARRAAERDGIAPQVAFIDGLVAQAGKGWGSVVAGLTAAAAILFVAEAAGAPFGSGCVSPAVRIDGIADLFFEFKIAFVPGLSLIHI